MNPEPAYISHVISADCLKDESRLTGHAESISCPSDESELADILRYFSGKGTRITVQGARTGITGGAVPFGGHIISLGRMNSIRHSAGKAGTGHMIAAQPGVLLDDLRSAAAEMLPGYFFPPDPTETTASIGGMAACNSSGARSYKYGPVRGHINGLRVVTADGSVISLKRGMHKAEGRNFSLTAENGHTFKGSLPSYDSPDIKNAAGYYSRNDMDLADLFIGSEGTLGIISEIEVAALPEPAHIWGMMMLFCDEAASLCFVDHLKTLGAGISAIEFFDAASLGYIKNLLPCEDRSSAIYAEIEGDSEKRLTGTALLVANTAEKYGAGDDDTILADTPSYFQRLKKIRHAVPECINTAVSSIRQKNPGIIKLATDMAVPSGSRVTLMDLYRKGLADEGLKAAIFGHIGDDHLHVNILPGTTDEYDRGLSLCMEWACKIAGLGGTVSAEHGIGKLKKPLLKIMYGENGIEEMRKLKLLFDPDSILNHGNLF